MASSEGFPTRTLRRQSRGPWTLAPQLRGGNPPPPRADWMRLARPARRSDMSRLMATAASVTVMDDEQVRVTTWTFSVDGDETGHHVHEYDYLVVPVTGGSFTIINDDTTTRELVQHAGEPYRGTAGASHNVVNSSGSTAVFVEIELKG